MKGREVDLGLLILRIGLGMIMLFYGSQKMLGLFGGKGYGSTVAGFEGMGIKPVFANLAIFGEFFGSLGVLFGALTRVAAFGIACTMAVAVYTKLKAPDALSNLLSSGKSEDASAIFFPAIIFFAAASLIFLGGGSFALDRALFSRTKRRK